MCFRLKAVMIAVLLVFACVSCTNRQNEEHTVDATYEASKEEMRKVYEEYEGKELLIGLWEGPRKHAMKTQEDADARYAEIREAGINMVYVYAELDDDGWLEKTIKAAEKNNIRLIIDLSAVYANRDAFYEAVDKTKDSKAVIGYNIVDEPGHKLFGTLGNVRTKLKEHAGDDYLVFCNLFPNYAADYVLTDEPIEGMTKYQTYLELFVQKVKPDILHFDNYPYTGDKSTDNARILKLIENLSDVRNAGAKYNIPIGGFLQSCRWGNYQNGNWSGTRLPNELEYRFDMNLHLVFGCKTVSNFLYWSRDGSDPGQRMPGHFEGLITYQGERTPMYDIVRKQNTAIHAMKGVYLDYDHKAFMVVNFDEAFKKAISDNLIVESYKEVSSVESDGEFLIGCFENDGKTGLYVMNFRKTEEDESVLKIVLSQNKDYKVWGAEGLVQMGRNSEISVSLLPSDACFVEIG